MPDQGPLRARASALPPQYQEGQHAPLSQTLDGSLRITGIAGGGGGSVGGLTNTELRASAVPVTGTVAVGGTVPVSGPLTDAQLRAAAVPVSGTLAVNNFPATQPVSGTFWQATQPVSGPLTDTQLRAAAVPVSNASLPLPAGASTEATLALIKAKTDNLDVALSTRAGSSVSVSNFPATQPVSGTFWQATQPVSGPLTDTQLRASAVPVSGTTTANQGTANATPWNENLAQVGGAALTQGQKTMAASVPVVIASDQSVIPTKAVQAVTFTAIYRLAARPYALSNAFAAAGRKQYATIHHAATATKLVKVKRVEVALESSSAAAIIMADLVRITAAPVTPNPAVTPTPQFPGDGTAETTCMCLPTTAGTEGAVHSFLEWNLGITGAASVLNPPPALNWYTLWPQVQGAGEVPENKYPTIRAGTLEGFAVTLDSNAIATVKGFVVIEFSEE